MRKVLLLFLFITSISAHSQTLNKLGKIEIDEIPQMPGFTIEKINGNYNVIKDTITLDGNTFFELPSGFLTALIVVDDEKDFIKHYNSQGKLLATVLTNRIINLKVSDNGNKAVFYNEDSIYLVNLTTYNTDTLKGSFVYGFVKGDKLIYYNRESKNVMLEGNTISIDEFPNQFIEYKDKIYAITKNNIYQLKSSGFNAVYEFKGEFYDAKIIGDEFYFVEKREKRKKESFSLYKTSDFSKFLLMDRIDELNR